MRERRKIPDWYRWMPWESLFNPEPYKESTRSGNYPLGNVRFVPPRTDAWKNRQTGHKTVQEYGNRQDLGKTKDGGQGKEWKTENM